MVLLRNNHHASSKMSSAMALVASRRTGSHNGRHPENTEYPIKRRSMAAASTAAFPRKRPRTSWGKPHSDPSALRCSHIFIKEEAAASSTSFSDDDYCGGTVSSSITVPSPCSQATSFVKTEPLQHLAIKLEEEIYIDGGPLHQVPTFFPMEHLLTTPIKNLPGEFIQISRCAHISPPLSSLTWPASPHSPLCSSASDEFSGDNMLNWDQDCHEESCDFLSERFYEIERDMNSIMGDAIHQVNKSAKPLLQQQEEFLVMECKREQSSTTTFLVPKAEEASECSQLSEVSCTASLGSADTSTTATTTGDGEEEYRIDLVDFEPENGDCVNGEGDNTNHKTVAGGTASCQKPTLSLNYDEVMREWCDRGPLFTDGGSWGWGCCSSPDDYALDLAVRFMFYQNLSVYDTI